MNQISFLRIYLALKIQRKAQPFENKPIDIRTLDNKITIYAIDYTKHQDSYNFFDSEK